MRIAEDIRTLAHCSRVHQNWHMLPCHCVGPRYGHELHATREGRQISALYSFALGNAEDVLERGWLRSPRSFKFIQDPEVAGWL